VWELDFEDWDDRDDLPVGYRRNDETRNYNGSFLVHERICSDSVLRRGARRGQAFS